VAYLGFGKRGGMANAEREPITGVWGGAPCGLQGKAPGREVRRAKPPEAETLFAFEC